MLSVALTGNVASGKSTVAELWASEGVPVISADELSRRAVEPGSPGLWAVQEAFGGGVMAADGSLDRASLRDIVFSDDDARGRLEEILHPLIWEMRAAWLAERRAEGSQLVVSEIPLLFELGRQADFDVTVLVDAPPEIRLARLVQARDLDEEQARRVMSSQMDPGEKRRLADIVIENAGSPAELADRAAAVLTKLRSRPARLRMDLHLHTSGSFDCLSDPEAVLEVARAKGYGRIAITDHNRLHVALQMAEAYPDQIIPGEEVKTAEGLDVIGLYLTEEIPKGTPARRTIELIREQGGIPYLPHPYAPGKGGGGRLADSLAPLCDVVEVFNARLHSEAPNRMAEELADRHKTLRGAGSDAHTLGELGNAFVEVDHHPNTRDGLLRALAQARTGGTSASHLVHLASTWAKVRKRLPGAG
jgi:dephospho-CoA kinase